MDIFEAIFNRRTIKDFKSDPVPDDVLERALEAGTWAQNHRMTQPWRFTIMGPETRSELASIESKILAKPLVVAVSYRLSDDKQQKTEDYAATCCAVQNIQLAAWALGLGMQWSTGKLTRNPGVYDLLDINPDKERIAGLLYFGYPARIPAPAPRKPLKEVSRWRP